MSGWMVAALLLGMSSVDAPQSGSAPTVVVHGDVSALAVSFPKQHDTRELRTRARIDVIADPKSWLRLRFEGAVDALVADRAGRVTAVVPRVREGWAEVRGDRADLRAGYGRLVWGRLDEVMPSDVINPIDTARFLLDGRSEARLPVAFVRGRAFLTPGTTLEGLVTLPGRRGRLDELDEPTSPFNLRRDFVWPAFPRGAQMRREEPPARWSNLQGGARLSTTMGRVDVSVSGYRGFENVGALSFEMAPAGPHLTVIGELVERYPRFTMVATDFETVAGAWAIRGEVAAFVDRQVFGPAGPADGRVVDAGLGVDRSAGEYRLFASAVWHREWTVSGPSFTQQHVNLVGSIERRFARERYLARVFGVWNPDDRSGFVRGIGAWSVRDNLSLEASGGAFLGIGTDAISRFTGRDFVFVRLRYHF